MARIRFVNQSGQTVRIYRIDYQGERQLLGDVPAPGAIPERFLHHAEIIQITPKRKECQTNCKKNIHN